MFLIASIVRLSSSSVELSVSAIILTSVFVVGLPGGSVLKSCSGSIDECLRRRGSGDTLSPHVRSRETSAGPVT